MIAKLKGIIDNIGEDCCIIDVNGVGYLVNMSSRSLSKLKQGEYANLLIETVIKEDSITLFGFQSPWEKEWFNTLTKIQGVGGKVCLSILSALSPAQLSQAVAAQDKSSFLRAAGVGPKLAARLVTELKDKIVTIPIEFMGNSDLNADKTYQGETAENSPQKSPQTLTEDETTAYSKTEDVTSALTNLGYPKIDAYRIATETCLNNPQADLATLIRLSLKEFNL
ncbi:MAG: Holliday junction branch migration protein RuvA [Alphaproteobacteria bacterium]|nr:Holliday junction branch migration protein RuvA [Alphaproteobacteria bacterium]